ncbi:MAG TPA: hypothetical protein VN222_02855 [Novosphingobium sp.]|nr:hypothetical protein [Novosphingobium sp.]
MKHFTPPAARARQPVADIIEGARTSERQYRARLALLLGLSHDDIRCVFDLSEQDLAKMIQERAR